MAFNKTPFEFPGDATPVAGSGGRRFPQDSTTDKPVFIPGATKANRDIDVDNHDLINDGDFETSILTVSGSSSVNMALISTDSNQFDVELDIYDDAEDTVLTTLDKDRFNTLRSTGSKEKVDDSFPVAFDKVKVRITDSSGGGPNTVTGSINFNVGNGGTARVTGADGEVIQGRPLNLNVSNSDTGLVTWAARATQDVALDELRIRSHDSSGSQIDPLNQDALASVDNDQIITREQNRGVVDYGQDTVATSGTAEALNGGNSVSVDDGETLWVKALAANGGNVYVGDSNVTTSNGFELGSGESIPIPATDVSDVFIDVGTDGDGVSWVVA